jgi:hypothetical protein
LSVCADSEIGAPFSAMLYGGSVKLRPGSKTLELARGAGRE